jgi:hypothetical protein
MTQVTRTARPVPFNPASGKTVTVTITMPVREGTFREDSASTLAAQAKELVRRWARYVDPDQATVEVSYDYPQWKHTYGPEER